MARLSIKRTLLLIPLTLATLFLLSRVRSPLETDGQRSTGERRDDLPAWEPPIPRPDLTQLVTHDVLRRRSYAPNAPSLDQLPIDRPSDPLRDVDLSSSFRAIYKRLFHDRAARDFNLQRDYEQRLNSFLYQNKTAECGEWQGRYTELHREGRKLYNDSSAFARKPAGVEERPKRLVSACAKGYGQCGGLGDRMFNIVSTFMLALLLDRIFMVYWSPDFPLLAETVFHSPHINWAWPGPPNEATPEDMVPPEHPAVHNPHLLFIEWQPELIDKHFIKASRQYLEEELMPSETITLQGNKGILVRQLLHNNTWQAEKLSKWGLTPETAYGCVIHYLFEPLPHTRALIVQYQALLSLDFVFSITLQIRVGDDAFINPEEDDDFSRFAYYFICALDAATTFADPEQHTHFIICAPFRHLLVCRVSDNRTDLATDHARLAEEAVRDVTQFIPANWTHPVISNFYPMVLTTGVKPIHLEKGDDLEGLGQGRYNTLHDETKHYAMQSSILDNYIQDATGLKFLCHWSGFGVISQLRAWNGPSAVLMPTIWSKGERPSPLSIDGLQCSDPDAYYNLEDMTFSTYKGA